MERIIRVARQKVELPRWLYPGGGLDKLACRFGAPEHEGSSTSEKYEFLSPPGDDYENLAVYQLQ